MQTAVTFSCVMVLVMLASCGPATADDDKRDSDDSPVMHTVLLQFSLNGEDPYEFASYAPEFSELLEEMLMATREFDSVDAVVLGVGKTDCGITVIAVLEYTKNTSSLSQMDWEETMDYIVEVVGDNKSTLEQICDVQSVRSVNPDSANIKFLNRHKRSAVSTGALVAMVIGGLALVGVATLVIGTVVHYTMRKKTWEKLPLLPEEGEDSAAKQSLFSKSPSQSKKDNQKF